MASQNKRNILYIFGGEKAQGAEIVIERLMLHNEASVQAHLILAPGKFAAGLMESGKPYRITLLNQLKKLNRSSTSSFEFLLRAGKNFFAVSYHVFKYIKKHQITVVHSNTTVPASYLIPLILYSRLFMPAMRWCWSDHDLNYYSKIDAVSSKLCVRLYDITLVVSEAVKRKYKPNRKIKVLYNGLDIQKFKPNPIARAEFRGKNALDEHMVVVGIAASITPDKGQQTLIKAFSELSGTYKNTRLLLAGGYAADTPLYNEAVRVAVKNNSSVTYLGYVDNMIEFYNGCDVIVNNSNSIRSESLGTSIYEAMACGKILVAAATGGTPEIITSEKDGFLFETDNVQDLQKTLSYIFTNYSTLDHVKSAAIVKVIEKFNVLTMIKNYNNLLTQLK